MTQSSAAISLNLEPKPGNVYLVEERRPRASYALFDQIIVSGNLLGKDYSSYRFLQAKIFNKPFMTQKEGAFQGYPFRTYAGGVYLGGYSDHFPAYIFLVREK